MRTLILFPLIAAVTLFAADEKLTKEVRHELVMLPYYSVFDNLAYRVDGSRVTLFGQVVRPTLKSDAENAIQFSRSAPGIATALVGMGHKEHVAANLKVALVPPAAEGKWSQLFSKG